MIFTCFHHIDDMNSNIWRSGWRQHPRGLTHYLNFFVMTHTLLNWGSSFLEMMIIVVLKRKKVLKTRATCAQCEKPSQTCLHTVQMVQKQTGKEPKDGNIIWDQHTEIVFCHIMYFEIKKCSFSFYFPSLLCVFGSIYSAFIPESR